MKTINLLDLVKKWTTHATGSSEQFVCKMTAVMNAMSMIDYHIYNIMTKEFVRDDYTAASSMSIWKMYHGHGIGHLIFKHKES